MTIKVGRWKLTDAANKVHAAQPASRTSQPSSAVASPQVQRQPTTPANTPSTSAQENAPPTNGTSSASTSKQVLPGDGDEERRVPSPAPQPSFGGYMATQEIPQVTIQDGQRLASELSPVTEGMAVFLFFGFQPTTNPKNTTKQKRFEQNFVFL